jgi:RNA polymerase sigma-70 factor (ECF subfamily)
VFLAAYRAAKTQPVESWRGFLRRLAACRALDRLRQRKPAFSLEGLALVASRGGPEEAVLARELAERLRQAVTQLPEREASVFCLRYYEELSYQQIAETLNISPGAVATALHKARAKLEALLPEANDGD